MIEKIGKHFDRNVFYLDFNNYPENVLSIKNWVCFAICNHNINKQKFGRFTVNAINNGLLEFKAQGKLGENLHGEFDEVMVDLEISENRPYIDICTTGDNDTDLANAFWECFYASLLPERTDWDNVNIVCTNIDGKDYKDSLINLLIKFDKGWIPED